MSKNKSTKLKDVLKESVRSNRAKILERAYEIMEESRQQFKKDFGHDFTRNK